MASIEDPDRVAETELETALALARRISHALTGAVEVRPELLDQALVCIAAEGHILLEDLPGVGKTSLAQALARSLGLSFQRIQFTSDLLPSDIVGVSIFNQKNQQFEFVPGPIFASVVLADEINRATPKTQSALLEAMSEGQVTVERKRYLLPEPFLVIATQNPLEHQGTFPLPESQLDRFLMSLQIGYPPPDAERALLLSGGIKAILDELPAVLDREELVGLQSAAQSVVVSPKLASYMLDLADATRQGSEFLLGVSTRGAQGLYRAVQALALCEGRRFAVPDDVQRLAVPVLAHRVVLRRGGGGADATRAALERIVSSRPVPL